MDKNKNQRLAWEITDFCKKRLQTKVLNSKSRFSILYRLVFAILAAPIVNGPDGDDKRIFW